MNKFEEQIQEQRSSLDSQEPRIDKMWASVEGGLSKRKKRPTLYWLTVAAAAAVLVVFLLIPEEKSTVTLAEEALPGIEVFDEEAAKQESLLQDELDQKLSLLAGYEVSGADLETFQNELDLLDQMDLEMRELLGKTQNQEKLLRKLLEHYEKKIRIIERMIQKLEKQKRNENRKQDIRA